jgi:hypothetical protein
MKRLRYVNFQTEPGPQGAKALLTVKFMDHGGEVYSWMPRSLAEKCTDLDCSDIIVRII